MPLFFPNSGELEKLRSMLTSHAWLLGLYRNIVSQDGNLVFSVIQGLTVTGGYAVRNIENVLSPAKALNKWFVSTNIAGKAEGEYSNVPLEWTFTQENVNAGETAHGIYAWTLLLGFSLGAPAEIRVGDTVTGAISNATGIVTQVRLLSGIWANNTAAGFLCIRTQTGIFQAAEDLRVAATTRARAAGDSERHLLFVESFTTPQVIDTVGQRIRYTLRVTLSTQ